VAAEVKLARRVRGERPAGLTEVEAHSLLRAAGQSPHGLGKRNYALLQVMLQAGLRVGEMAALRISDVLLRERCECTGDLEEIMNKASCLSLLSNTVLVWNTVRISEIVERLRAAGEQILDTDLARVSPLCYAHIIPNGTYNFEGAIQGGNPAHNTLP
jgi:integrase